MHALRLVTIWLFCSISLASLFYSTPDGRIYGPFSKYQIKKWFNDGYLDKSILVRDASSSHFESIDRYLSRINKPRALISRSLPKSISRLSKWTIKKSHDMLSLTSTHSQPGPDIEMLNSVDFEEKEMSREENIDWNIQNSTISNSGTFNLTCLNDTRVITCLFSAPNDWKEITFDSLSFERPKITQNRSSIKLYVALLCVVISKLALFSTVYSRIVKYDDISKYFAGIFSFLPLYEKLLHFLLPHFRPFWLLLSGLCLFWFEFSVVPDLLQQIYQDYVSKDLKHISILTPWLLWSRNPDERSKLSFKEEIALAISIISQIHFKDLLAKISWLLSSILFISGFVESVFYTRNSLENQLLILLSWFYGGFMILSFPCYFRSNAMNEDCPSCSSKYDKDSTNISRVLADDDLWQRMSDMRKDLAEREINGLIHWNLAKFSIQTYQKRYHDIVTTKVIPLLQHRSKKLYKEKWKSVMKLWFYGVSWLLASFLRAAIIVFPSFSPSSLLSNTNPFSQKSLVSFFKSDLITTSIVWAPLVMGFQCLLQLMLIQYLLHPIALDISSYSPAIDINTTTLSNYQNSWEAKVPWSPTFPDINELEWKKSLEIHGLSILNGEGKSIVNNFTLEAKLGEVYWLKVPWNEDRQKPCDLSCLWKLITGRVNGHSRYKSPELISRGWVSEEGHINLFGRSVEQWTSNQLQQMTLYLGEEECCYSVPAGVCSGWHGSIDSSLQPLHAQAFQLLKLNSLMNSLPQSFRSWMDSSVQTSLSKDDIYRLALCRAIPLIPSRRLIILELSDTLSKDIITGLIELLKQIVRRDQIILLCSSHSFSSLS